MDAGKNYPLTDLEYDILDYLESQGEVAGSQEDLIENISHGLNKERCLIEMGVACLIKFGYIKPKSKGGVEVVLPPNTIYLVTVDNLIYGPLFSHGDEHLTKIEFVSGNSTFISVTKDYFVPILQSFILKFDAKLPKWDFHEKSGFLGHWLKYKGIKKPVVRVTDMVLHYGEKKVSLPIEHVVDLSTSSTDSLSYQIRIMRLEE